MTLIRGYQEAKRAVISGGYSAEISWQQERRLDTVNEQSFLREYAWVVLNSGMRESVVSRIFPHIECCFLNWESARRIVEYEHLCVEASRRYFDHGPKIEALVYTARLISHLGFPAFHDALLQDPLSTLERLPFIGPVTKFHLAKNLGVDIAKPDRHLVRIAKAVGAADVQALCLHLAEKSGDSVSIVDLVLWRYATLQRDYARLFKAFASHRGRPRSPCSLLPAASIGF